MLSFVHYDNSTASKNKTVINSLKNGYDIASSAVSYFSSNLRIGMHFLALVRAVLW